VLLATRSVRDHLRAPHELTIPTKLLTEAESTAVQNVSVDVVCGVIGGRFEADAEAV
jgi:hypothetical protein